MSKVFRSIHPFDQRLIAEYPVMDAAQVNKMLALSQAAFAKWSATSLEERAAVVNKAAEVLRRDLDVYAALITTEMGKILPEAKAEVEKCATACNYYAEHAASMMQPEQIASDADLSYVVFDPIGTVFAVMPWNYPFWQVFRFAAPALMAGNAILLKHAPNVTGCALAMEKIFLDAGLPEGVMQTLIIDVDQVEHVIAHDAVQGVTLTGSEKAGSAVGALAGKHIKRSVLELGGSDALIVLRDADVYLAAKVALQSRFQNAGQSCIASKRFIVEQSVHADFLQALQDGVGALKQGDPFHSDITTGPMARKDLAEQLHAQEMASIQKGAKVVIGGGISGANFQPAILDGVQEGMPAFDEELFGPVASIILAKDADHAVRMANTSRYGLGASIYSRDIDYAQQIARKIQSGAVFINALVKSDPRLPFGGVKKSGYGRELSHYGLKEFTNIKTVYVRK